MGQTGKDVIWIPTPDTLVTKMLQAAKTTENDVVYDLGAGEGKIPIAAAREFKARSVGIEYNPDMAALAKRNAERAGVADKVKIIAGDIFENDFSGSDVVTLYLLPELNFKLRPSILKMKPGTRVVSHAFNMRDWEPTTSSTTTSARRSCGSCPATISGKWQFDEGGGGFKGTLDLIQAYQRVGGNMMIGKQAAPIMGRSSWATTSRSRSSIPTARCVRPRQVRRRQVRRLDAPRRLRYAHLRKAHRDDAAQGLDERPPRSLRSRPQRGL
jgi:SAM-dependent methyltransferase